MTKAIARRVGCFAGKGTGGGVGVGECPGAAEWGTGVGNPGVPRWLMAFHTETFLSPFLSFPLLYVSPSVFLHCYPFASQEPPPRRPHFLVEWFVFSRDPLGFDQRNHRGSGGRLHTEFFKGHSLC